MHFGNHTEHVQFSSTIFGSLCLSSGGRSLAFALPSGARKAMSENSNGNGISNFFKSKNAWDCTLLAKFLVANFHEVTHFHQLLLSTSGLVAMEVSLRRFTIMHHLVHNHIEKSFPLLENIPDDEPLLQLFQDTSSELMFLSGGRVCFHCQPNLLPLLPANLIYSEIFSDHFLTFGTQNKIIQLAHYKIHAEDEFKSFGFTAIMESLSFEQEQIYSDFLANLYFPEEIQSFTSCYDSDYRFIRELLEEKNQKSDGDLINYNKITRIAAWTALNAGVAVPSRNTNLNSSPIKLMRAMEILSKNTTQNNLIELLDQELVNRFGYASLNEIRNQLIITAKGKIAELTEQGAPLSFHSASLLCYYQIQLDFLSKFEDGLQMCEIMTSEIYLAHWGKMPKPPYSILLNTETPPRKFLLMKEPQQGFHFFLMMLQNEILEQAMFKSEILCPIKQQGIECHLKSNDCGCVKNIANFEKKSSCSFENLLNGLKNGDSGDLIEHIEFVDGLLILGIELDE